uniref:ACB domain-containing protein n=1 Tax=Arcella intermedia TaxID=1963864 RepID=A0A6B2LUV9_9EUKA
MSEAEFKAAVTYVTKGPTIPNLSNDLKLKFYGLFKQATHGPCKEKAPSRLQVVAKMKWDAYNKLGKMSQEEARQKYINSLQEVAPKWKNWRSAKL